MDAATGAFPWSLTAAATVASITTSSAATATATQSPGDPGEVLQQWSSLIGIITAIVGNVLIALALNVQRYAHTRLHKERVRVRQRARAALKQAQSSSNGASSYGTMPGEPNGHRNGNGRSHDGTVNGAGRVHNGPELVEADPLSQSSQSIAPTDVDSADGEHDKTTSTYLKSPYWWLGQILITVGEMGNFLAYGFAPASIVSPLGVVALISNCIIAPVMFHERFRARDFWGVVIAVGGVVTVVLSANQEETKLEPHDVWHAITTMEFEIYLGVTVSLIVLLMWASSKYGRRTVLIDLGLVGLFGGYTALATKGVSSMLSSTLWRAFTTPVTYALVLILLVTAIMQIRYVNKALQRFNSTQVIPIQFVLFTLCVILGSAVLYRDFEKTTAKQAATFVGGCLLTFFGVFLITSGRQQNEADDEDLLSDIDGIEETIGLMRHGEATAGPLPAQDVESPKPPSRRPRGLSRVSLAGTAKPRSPQDKSDKPRIHQGTSDSAPNLIAIEPGTPVLSDNPWRESWSSAASLPVGTRTVSTDSAVAESAVIFTPPGNSAATTPIRDPAATPTYPTDRPFTPRQSSGGLSRVASHHRSKTFISPSPLSSTVTTVVKDAFLRGYDASLPNTSSLRRIRSSIRASLFFNFDEDEENITRSANRPIPTSDLPLPSPLETSGDENSETDDSSRRRSRSVSDVIGDFFRPRKKSKNDTPSGDVESGPSHNSE
ncbi:DUF803 domain membrane protein [Metarhizium acridum CQMa 102]|uniref:DUF803 domain membrane protein n=1 Tax=Metarhizium acridum (strain CQMa 102) TaxID=655827 RepID=E9E9Y7_METAQ|nr:DUF803 domain membrane protein [Metarhizium acridum CQMa 102]EFY87237.1 DUF803 domain membrane protein [Metarhizium acridum CQMa 102]